MAKERLDQILLRKGLVTEDQIRQALLRQKSHRGPLGSHLMYYKFITEENLVSALAEQFGVQGVVLGRGEIPPEVIQKVPAAIAEKFGVCPFAFDPETRTLSLAMLDPEKTEAIYLVKDASKAWHVEPYAAAESALRNTVRRHYHGVSHDGSVDQIIELPDLFEGESPGAASVGSTELSCFEKETALRNVLMVTQSPFLKGLLVSIFEREGFSLTVLGEKEDVLAELADRVYDHILVAEEMEAAYREWIRTENLPLPRGEHSVFTSVSHALLDNPVPYHRMAASLIHALMESAESRCAGRHSRPPYELICKDAGDLARAVGLGRLAADGVQIASLLLCPSKSSGRGEGGGKPPRPGSHRFEGVDRSLESAKALSFPWDVFGCLSLFFRLLAGEPSGGQGTQEDPDLRLAVQVLALVWHRHAALGRIEGNPQEVLFKIKEGLNRLEGIPPSSEVLEAYGRLLERRQGQTRAVVRKDIFIVRERSDAVRPLIAHLRREGYSIVEVKDLSEALHLHERRQPDAMVIHYDDFPDQATRLGRLVRSGSTTLLYALTAQTKPSLIMSLLDAGFDDVFFPPLNYELICARITKALVAQEQQGTESRDRAGFRGSFKELPFVDLMQALALSQRSCAIRLDNRNGGRAEIYLRDGRMVFAESEELSGVEAVYAVIRWREEGTFQVGPVFAYPEENISLPNDFVLMEGCRLLDEGSEIQGSGTGDQGSGTRPA
jgi:DNA-binding response OmpR family regulator